VLEEKARSEQGKRHRAKASGNRTPVVDAKQANRLKSDFQPMTTKSALR
jgi:hypothetical protein